MLLGEMWTAKTVRCMTDIKINALKSLGNQFMTNKSHAPNDQSTFSACTTTP